MIPQEWILQIQAMDQWTFYMFLLAAVMAVGFGFYRWRKSFAHARVMEDTATSKARSAAQGFVELTGTQTTAMDTRPVAPLTRRDVTWWSYQIEKKTERTTSGGKKKTDWVTVEQKTSPHLILLDDGTGEVVVNPAGADVTPTEKKVWYGRTKKPTSFPSGRIHLSVGARYRYTEEVMFPGDPIYALGHYETRQGIPDSREKSRMQAEILAEWKENPAELAERFDEDGDGRVDMEEWERARAAAEAAVERRAAEAAEESEANLLLKPPDGQPFILSSRSQDELTKVYRLRAAAWLLLFLAGVVATGVLLTARFGMDG